MAEKKPNEDTCVCCGEPVPEGRQICHDCEANRNRFADREENKEKKEKTMKEEIAERAAALAVPGIIIFAALVLIVLCFFGVSKAMDRAARDADRMNHEDRRAEQAQMPLTEDEIREIRRAAAEYPLECGEPALDCYAVPVEADTVTEYILVPELWGATPKELEDVAKIVWLEARGEDAYTQKCITEVIFNRLLCGAWGDSLTSVIWARNQNGAYEFSTAPDLWKAELDPEILETVYGVFYNGCEIPRRIMWFRADHYHRWAGAVDEFQSDHTYFSSSCWVGDPDDEK